MEYKSFASHIILHSFFLLIYGNVEVKAKLLNIELYQEHCPYPSKLRTIARLRKLERIMKDIIVEQETEWKQKLYQLEKRFMDASSEIKKMNDVKSMIRRTEDLSLLKINQLVLFFFSVR